MKTTTQFDTTHLNAWTPSVTIVVVRRDPENADMDNPRGEVHGELYTPCYEYPNGRRFLSVQGFLDENECLIHCSWLNSLGCLPSENDYEGRPAYGSAAHCNQDEIDLEEREEEDARWARF